MDIDAFLKSDYFDSEKSKSKFKFVKLKTSHQKDFTSPLTLINHITCEDLTSNKKKQGVFGLSGSLLAYFEDNHSKFPKSTIDLTYARLKPLSSLESHQSYGFVIAKNERSYAFYFIDEESAEKWIKTLKSICILTDFHEDYRVIQMLGQGSFAKVYLIESKVYGTYFAAKAFAKEVGTSTKKISQKALLLNEIDMLRSITHENIIKLYEVYETSNTVFLVMELIKGKSLQESLQDPAFLKTCSEDKIANITQSLLEALDYLVSQKIIHRDLKPGNILIDQKTGKAKIIDFGLATRLSLPKYIYSKCGTPGYIPPEVFTYNPKKSETSFNDRYDLFSVGSILFYLLFKRPLFNEIAVSVILELNKDVNNIMLNYIAINKEINNSFSQINKQGLQLLHQLLEIDKNVRISAEEALSHPFVTTLSNKIIQLPSHQENSPFIKNITNDLEHHHGRKSLVCSRYGLDPSTPNRAEHLEKNRLCVEGSYSNIHEGDTSVNIAINPSTTFNLFTQNDISPISSSSLGKLRSLRKQSTPLQDNIRKTVILSNMQHNRGLVSRKTEGEITKEKHNRRFSEYLPRKIRMEEQDLDENVNSGDSSCADEDLGSYGDEENQVQKNFDKLNSWKLDKNCFDQRLKAKRRPSQFVH